VHATQSNICSALDFVYPEPCPNNSELNALIARFRESYTSVSKSRESKKVDEMKQRLVEFGQGTNTAFE